MYHRELPRSDDLKAVTRKNVSKCGLPVDAVDVVTLLPVLWQLLEHLAVALMYLVVVSVFLVNFVFSVVNKE